MEPLRPEDLLRRRAAPTGSALFALGFRPFFLGAFAYAALAMVVWFAAYQAGLVPPLAGLPAQVWHGHAMVFGYGAAVIAGFLLTAVRNWTERPTPTGRALAGLVAVWAIARIAPFVPFPGALALMVAADTAFLGGFLLAIARPIVAARQARHAWVLTGVAGLLGAEVLFAWRALGGDPIGATAALRAGLHCLVLLVLVVGRRVLPFFVERGLGLSAPLPVHPKVDAAIPPLVLAFAAADLLAPGVMAVGVPVAGALAVAAASRLAVWFQPRALRHPMLAVLYAGYAAIPIGFALHALAPLGVPAALAQHTLAVGAVGVMPLGMMSRVTLGHTGRAVAEPPRAAVVAFTLGGVALVARAFVPLVVPSLYRASVGVAQLAWIAAFVLMLWAHARMLYAPRPDGRPG